MALALWELAEGDEGPPEPARAGLRLLPPVVPETADAGICRRHPGADEPGLHRPRAGRPLAPRGLRTDSPAVVAGRARRPQRRRRLHLLAGTAVAALAVLLALPVRSLGGSPLTHAQALVPSTPGHPSVYVVRPGDTLWSIATRLDPSGDPRPLVATLSAENGSGALVPGEHLVLPG